MRAFLTWSFTTAWLVSLTGCHLIFPFDYERAAGSEAGVSDGADDLARKDSTSDRLQSIETGEDDTTTSKDAGPFTGWSTSFGGSSTDNPVAVAIDALDNVYVTGSFYNSIGFPGGTKFTSNGYTDVFIVSYSSTGIHRWTKTFGGTEVDSGLDIAVDGAGDVVVVGTLGTSVTFCNKTVGGLGGGDVLLAKLDQAGSCKWVTSIGGPQQDQGYGVATDPANNIYVTGRFAGSITQGTNPPLASTGGNDIFLGRYSSTGEAIWSKALGGIGDDMGWSVAVDASGNVYVTGHFTSMADFQGKKLTSNGVQDFFAASYTASDGGYRWATSAGGATGVDRGTAIAVDSKGDVFVTGYFLGSIFGKATAGSQDIFVARYSSQGNLVWAEPVGSKQSDWVSSLTVDPAGNLLLTGYISGDVTLPSGTITAAGSLDTFLIRMGPSGTILGGKGYGDKASDFGQDVATDSSGNVIIVGQFWDEIDFGYGPLKSNGNHDAFVAKVPPP